MGKIRKFAVARHKRFDILRRGIETELRENGRNTIWIPTRPIRINQGPLVVPMEIDEQREFQQYKNYMMDKLETIRAENDQNRASTTRSNQSIQEMRPTIMGLLQPVMHPESAAQYLDYIIKKTTETIRVENEKIDNCATRINNLIMDMKSSMMEIFNTANGPLVKQIHRINLQDQHALL